MWALLSMQGSFCIWDWYSKWDVRYILPGVFVLMRKALGSCGASKIRLISSTNWKSFYLLGQITFDSWDANYTVINFENYRWYLLIVEDSQLKTDHGLCWIKESFVRGELPAEYQVCLQREEDTPCVTIWVLAAKSANDCCMQRKPSHLIIRAMKLFCSLRGFLFVYEQGKHQIRSQKTSLEPRTGFTLPELCLTVRLFIMATRMSYLLTHYICKKICKYMTKRHILAYLHEADLSMRNWPN